MINKNSIPLFRLSLLSVTVAAVIGHSSVVLAEDTEEVVVTGLYSKSLEKSLDLKRKSTNMVDSITADDVGKLPDNNLAEALQRVPGVQVSRTNGEGQQISLRGLGPSFVRVVLDGMPVSAASEGSVDAQSRNREFDFDLLPSELFSQLAVSKTPQASMVEGGLSGTINLRTARPFDREGFNASYQVQGAYQTTSEKLDPRLSFSVSNTWDTFGALFSFSTSSRSFRTDGWSAQGWTSGKVTNNNPAAGYSKGFDWNLPSVTSSNPASLNPNFVNESGLTNAALANAQIARLPRPEIQVGERDRIGSTLSLEWKPTDQLSFNLDAIYAKLEADFDRYTNNLLVRNTGTSTNNSTGFGYLTPSQFQLDSKNTVTHGVISGAKFWSENRVFQQESDFKHVNLGAKWEIQDNLNLETKVSHADSDFRWRMTTYLLLSNPSAVTFDVKDRLPVVTPGIDLANINNWSFNSARIQPRTREESNDNLSLDLTWGEDNRNLRVGALYNKFSRERLSFSTTVNTNQGSYLQPFGYTGPNDINLFSLTGYATPVPVKNYGKNIDDNLGYYSWATADLKAFGKLMSYSKLDAAANLDYQNSGSFDEKNLSAYVEGNYALDVFARELRVNGGLRYVKTDQDLNGFIRLPTTPAAATNLFGLRPANFGTNTISGSYSELLPSINLSYDISEKVLGRLSASKGLTRPSPADIQPFTSLSTSGVVTQGNPNLSPYLSNQVDMGLEWYFEKGAVLGGNVFYKAITGFVQRKNLPQPFRNAGIPIDTITDATFLALIPNGLDSVLLFNTPVNDPSKIHLRGAEFLYQQHLDVIAKGLGLSFNFTRLDSGKSVVTGLAKNNYNAVVYYEQDRYDLRFSYNYRGDYVECTLNCGSTSPETQYRKAAGYLDFSSSYNFEVGSHSMSVTFEALNLLDEEEYSYNGYENRAASLNHPGRQYMLGLRGKF